MAEPAAGSSWQPYSDYSEDRIVRSHRITQPPTLVLQLRTFEQISPLDALRMATRRRIGVSLASTEAARRQLMQPVPCWERIEVPSEINANIKVYKWVKIDRIQHFSDDEGDADEPLAPLPDEPEIVDGDEEMEQDETPARTEPPISTKDIPEPDLAEDAPSKAPSPKPHLTMATDHVPHHIVPIGEELDLSLNPPNIDMEDTEDIDDDDDKQEGKLELDMAVLGPDGVQLEGAHDLSQLQATDPIAGNLMDESNDPFAPVS